MIDDAPFMTWGNLLYSVQTGGCAFEKTFGEPLFDFLGKHPEKARIFDAAMTSVHGRESQAMLDVYDLSDVGTFVDVGGGNGKTLIRVLERYPSIRECYSTCRTSPKRPRRTFAAGQSRWASQARAGELFRVDPHWWRCVPAAAYHSRLVRRAIDANPDHCAPRHARQGTAARCRKRDPARQRTLGRQDARPGHDGFAGRHGTDRDPIPRNCSVKAGLTAGSRTVRPPTRCKRYRSPAGIEMLGAVLLRESSILRRRRFPEVTSSPRPDLTTSSSGGLSRVLTVKR